MSYAKTHIGSLKSGICAVFRLRYIEVVHTDSPAPPGFPNKTTKVFPMSLIRFERALDRLAPAFLMALGLIAAFGSASLGA